MSSMNNDTDDDATLARKIAGCGLRAVRAYIKDTRSPSKEAEANARRQASFRARKAEEDRKLRARLEHVEKTWRPIPAMTFDEIRAIQRSDNAQRIGRQVLELSGWRKRLILFLLE